MDEHTQDNARKWFRLGITFSWIPSIPLIVGVLNSFRGIQSEKATGLAAVAGGISEVYLMSGLLLTVGLELGAIVLLMRSFSKGHIGRTLISLVSLAWSTLVLFLFGLGAWLFYIYLPHARITR